MSREMDSYKQSRQLKKLWLHSDWRVKVSTVYTICMNRITAYSNEFNLLLFKRNCYFNFVLLHTYQRDSIWCGWHGFRDGVKEHGQWQ